MGQAFGREPTSRILLGEAEDVPHPGDVLPGSFKDVGTHAGGDHDTMLRLPEGALRLLPTVCDDLLQLLVVRPETLAALPHLVGALEDHLVQAERAGDFQASLQSEPAGAGFVEQIEVPHQVIGLQVHEATANARHHLQAEGQLVDGHSANAPGGPTTGNTGHARPGPDGVLEVSGRVLALCNLVQDAADFAPLDQRSSSKTEVQQALH
mmetsp:Transcript_44711/g.130153  ORF Transcript_44711/g.130153 Transcript_44711/m.130153 type:complete len:209 (+) Transcript_44711:1128-1754(+)